MALKVPLVFLVLCCVQQKVVTAQWWQRASQKQNPISSVCVIPVGYFFVLREEMPPQPGQTASPLLCTHHQPFPPGHIWYILGYFVVSLPRTVLNNGVGAFPTGRIFHVVPPGWFGSLSLHISLVCHLYAACVAQLIPSEQELESRKKCRIVSLQCKWALGRDCLLGLVRD